MVTPDLAGKHNAGKIVGEVAKAVGGKGGGRADMAQGGGSDASRARRGAGEGVRSRPWLNNAAGARAFTLDATDAGTRWRPRCGGACRAELERRARALRDRQGALDGEVALDPAARVRRRPDGSSCAPTRREPSTLPSGFRVAFEDGHLVVIEKPSGVTSVPYERKETGTALDLIRATGSGPEARDGDAALHRSPHRQGHLGPALLREDPPRRARAARGLPAPHGRPRVPGRRRGRGGEPRASNRSSSPIAATASAARPATPIRGSWPSPT